MKKALYMLLVLVMLLGMVLMTVFATEGTQETDAVEVVTKPTEIPEVIHEHDYEAVVTAPTCTEQGYTTYTCTCGDSYVDDYVNVNAENHTYKNGICTGCGKKLSFVGKTISILGDSISTYTGVSNDASVNATLKGGAIYYNAGTQGVYRADTWWQQTIDALGMELLVNNSWSGSTVLHTRSGTAGAYVDRCVQLHNTAGDEPDVIVVFLGTNDFSYYQSTLGTANIDYAKLITDNGDGTYTYATPKTTCEAYAVMLHKMINRYPDAEVYCMNLLPRRNPDHDGKDVVPAPTQFNRELEKLISHFGCTVVDLENCGITPAPENFDIYITDQRVHPGPLGMDKMTQAMIDTMMGKEDATFAVSQNLVNVTANAPGGIVLAGGSFKVVLTPAAGFEKLTVTVTMGGKDVTASVYSDGKVNIPAVTGDVVITASAAVDDTPNNYYWEISGNNFVNVAKNDLSENAITKKAGKITDGVMSSAYFQLEKPVVLRHNLPWIVEWRASGMNWTGMLLSGNVNSSAAGNSYLFKTTQNTGFIGFGEAVSGSYHNYGIALASQGVDLAAEHTYRLENRIAADGSNMVYLLLDGKDYGPMNHYYIGGNSNQGKQVDWLNGRDFCFFYIGSNGHPLNNCKLEYLTVWESGHEHTFENGICTGCGTEEPNPYTGKTIACIGDSITYGVGVTRDETDYVTLLAKALEMNYIRLGASGTTLCTDGHATCNIGKLTESNLAGADVVTILMGINDFVQAKKGYYTLGTIDSTDTSTIYGAVHMWCRRIEELRQTDSLKNTEFYFLTPVITSWNNSVSSARDWNQGKTNIHGYTLRDLCNAIIEVCALYDIPVIDLNLISGLYYNSAEDNTVVEFGGDGAHPGTVGHQMMADAIQNALLRNDLRDDHDHSYGSWITTMYPDCDSGEQQRVCSVCTATERKQLDGMGHTYENGICTSCSAMLGDLNHDGLVNADDLTLLARHVARIESLTGTALANADVNGDGDINADDLTKHARYVARIITDWDQA